MQPTLDRPTLDGPKLDWNVAVYCANEASRLAACLDSIVAALAGQRALISVILNGSRDASLEIAQAAAGQGAPLEIYSIQAADKSNAMNQFYYTIRAPAAAYAGVDGYVVVGAESFRAMGDRLARDPHANAVSGVAINGRSMAAATERTLRVGGQLHGQLHALRPAFLDRMVARGIRLPVGLYRGDGLLGSMAAHNLDARTTPWDDTRVPGVAGATYEIAALSVWRAADWQRQFRRKVRQSRGQWENAAIKAIIYEGGYDALPGDADTMIRRYLATHQPPVPPASQRPFRALALRQLRQAAQPEPASLLPMRVAP